MLAEDRDRQKNPGGSSEVSMKGGGKSWDNSSGKQRCWHQMSQSPQRSEKYLLQQLQGTPETVLQPVCV